MIKEGRIEEGIEYYEKALYIDFDATDLSSYYLYLGLPTTIKDRESMQTKKCSFPQISR